MRNCQELGAKVGFVQAFVDGSLSCLCFSSDLFFSSIV